MIFNYLFLIFFLTSGISLCKPKVKPSKHVTPMHTHTRMHGNMQSSFTFIKYKTIQNTRIIIIYLITVMLPVLYSIVEYTHVIRVQSPAVSTGLDHTLHYQSLTVCV